MYSTILFFMPFNKWKFQISHQSLIFFLSSLAPFLILRIRSLVSIPSCPTFSKIFLKLTEVCIHLFAIFKRSQINLYTQKMLIIKSYFSLFGTGMFCPVIIQKFLSLPERSLVLGKLGHSFSSLVCNYFSVNHKTLGFILVSL